MELVHFKWVYELLPKIAFLLAAIPQSFKSWILKELKEEVYPKMTRKQKKVKLAGIELDLLPFYIQGFHPFGSQPFFTDILERLSQRSKNQNPFYRIISKVRIRSKMRYHQSDQVMNGEKR